MLVDLIITMVSVLVCIKVIESPPKGLTALEADITSALDRRRALRDRRRANAKLPKATVVSEK